MRSNINFISFYLRANYPLFHCLASCHESSPVDCRLVDAIGSGPRLLPLMTSMEEGFVNDASGRDTLGSKQPNARTAFGITPDGSIILVMVAQKPSQPNNSGISLPQLADLMKSLGVSEAMNLDGGSSSEFYFQGKTFYVLVLSLNDFTREQ